VVPRRGPISYIYVKPGDQIPLIPRHRAKVSLDWDLDFRTRVGMDVFIVGPQRYDGDASNQQPMLPGYVTVSLNGAYKVTKDVEVFGRVNNVFNHRYYTYGTYFETDTLFNAFTNPQSVVPSQPLSAYAGLRVAF
jgi:iron complex outermembrane receptor protein